MIVNKIPDCFDQPLISYLREDGRQSSRALAARLGISSVAVGRRILKLIGGGMIRVTVFVDPRRVSAPLGIILGKQVAQAFMAVIGCGIPAYRLEDYLPSAGKLPIWARVLIVAGGFCVALPEWNTTVAGLVLVAAVVASLIMLKRGGTSLRQQPGIAQG